MAERILGPTGSKRRKRFLLVPILLVACTALFVIGSAQSASGIAANNVFELDASSSTAANPNVPSPTNTDNTTAGLADDWDRICKAASNPAQCQSSSIGASHATSQSFISETTSNGGANNLSIFTGGSTKDPLVLSGWNWKDGGGLPDKDNLLHGMAARYTCDTGAGCTGTSGDQYIYFGADRFDNSGDSQIGFWFFRNPVCTKTDGTFGNVINPNTGACSGTAVHAVGSVPHDPDNAGDILILSDFTQGGTEPTVSVFEFVGSGGSDGSLNLLGGGTVDIRDCATVPSTAAFCGAVNKFDGMDPAWTFMNKSHQTTYGHGEFYEGGLNLTNLGLQKECFASFLTETRSSQSTTATLKDFVLGKFQACNATAVTTPSNTGTVAPGTAVYDTDVITGSGQAIPPNPSSPPNVTFMVCGPIDATSTAGQSCDGSDAAHTAAAFGATKPLVHCTGASPPDPLPLCSGGADAQGVSRARSDTISPTAVGVYCFKADWTGDTNYPGGANDSGSNGSECFLVAKVPSQTNTSPSPGTITLAAVNAGGTVTDTANVSPTTIDLGPPTGTVTFFICAVNVSPCATGGTQVGSPVTLTLPASGSTSTATSAGVGSSVITSVGTYCFRGEYSGDGNYLASSDNDASECFTVTDTSTATTTQSWRPQDSVEIKSDGGTALTGTVTLRLFKNDTCTAGASDANVLYTTGALDVTTFGGTASDRTFTTTQSTVLITQANDPGAGKYSWQAVYSGGGSVSGKTSSCETTSPITINDHH